MKRLSILVFLVFALCSQVAFAASWQWIDSNDEFGLFFDTQTIKYGSHKDYAGNTVLDKNIVLFWEKTIYSPDGASGVVKRFNDSRYNDLAYAISKSGILVNERKLITYNDAYYSSHDILDSFDNYGVYDIIPESMGDSVYKAITNYCLNHDLDVSLNSY